MQLTLFQQIDHLPSTRFRTTLDPSMAKKQARWWDQWRREQARAALSRWLRQIPAGGADHRKEVYDPPASHEEFAYRCIRGTQAWDAFSQLRAHLRRLWRLPRYAQVLHFC